MRAAVTRLWSELRARSLSWLTLALIVAIVAGASIAAAMGAQRTDTAYDRFTVDRHAADVELYNTPNPQIPIADLTPATRLPQVIEAAPLKYFAISDSSANAYAAPDERAYGTAGLNRLKILDGRAARPDRADEAVVDFVLADKRHLHVGDTYTTSFSELPATSSGNVAADAQNATPVQLTFTIVGIAAAPGQFPPQDSRGYLADPPVYLTPAFYKSYAERVIALDIALFRIRPGQGAAFEDAVGKLSGLGPQPSLQFAQQATLVERSFHLQALALWLAAAALAFVGALMVAQLLSRQSAFGAADYAILRGLGMTPGQLWLLGVLRAAVLGGVGGLLAVVPATLLSTITPIGTARRAEPHPGIAINLGVIAIGVAATIAVVLVLALWPAWRASHVARASRATDEALLRPSIVAERLARSGAPAAMTTGVRMALQRGRGSTAVPVGTSVAAATLGVWAVVTALTFGANLTHLLDHPHQYGVTWDAEVLNDNGPVAVRGAVAVAARDPNVQAVAMLGGAPAALAGHEADAQVLDPRVGTIEAPVLQGRLPTRNGEVAIGSRTLDDLGLHVGGTVSVQVWDARAPTHRVSIVGRAILTPGNRSFGAAAEMGEGIVLTPAAVRAFAPHGFDIPDPYTVAVRFRPGVSPARGRAELERRLGGARTSWVVQAPTTPETLVDFGHVRALPLFLGGMLAVTAVIGIAHLLVSSIRQRRHDFAILKALGFLPGQVRRAIAWQATTLAAVALGVGVPLGIVGGRLIWLRVADQLGVLASTVTPALVLLVVAAGTFVLANLVALAPARVAGRTRAALVLSSQ